MILLKCFENNVISFVVDICEICELLKCSSNVEKRLKSNLKPLCRLAGDDVQFPSIFIVLKTKETCFLSLKLQYFHKDKKRRQYV